MHWLLSLEFLGHQEKENGPLSLLPSLLLFFFLILSFLLLPPSLGWMVNRSADVSYDRDSTDTLTGAVVITEARMASGYALSAPETSVPCDPRLLFLWSWLAIPSIRRPTSVAPWRMTWLSKLPSLDQPKDWVLLS